MTKNTFRIVPRGAFSWPAAFSVLARFRPLAHVWTGTEREVRLSLLADGDLTPVGVRLRFDGSLRGTVEIPALTSIVERQRHERRMGSPPNGRHSTGA